MFRSMTMLHSGHRRNPGVRFRTQAFTLCIVLSVCGHARPQQFSTTTQKDIVQAEREHLPEAQIGYLWGRLASDYAGQANFARAEDASFRSLRLLRNAPEAQKSYATLLEQPRRSLPHV
jgi:hypothetical protein